MDEMEVDASSADAATSRGEDVPTSRDEDVTDSLPADLDLSELDHAEYVFPNNNRRRVPGVLYLLIGGFGLLAYVLWSADSVLLNRGLLYGSIGMLAFAVYHLIAGWGLDHDERDALVAATTEVGFPVGHASAQMGWRGWLSKPTWRILLYSNEPQPSQRGLVLVDGVRGGVLDSIVEENPEDWSELHDATVDNADPDMAPDSQS